jgi:hypothetical protein
MFQRREGVEEDLHLMISASLAGNMVTGKQLVIAIGISSGTEWKAVCEMRS